MMDEYPATVTNISDPEKRGRIKVKCEAVLASGAELPGWIEPSFPLDDTEAGWFGIPKVGSKVTLAHRRGIGGTGLGSQISARVFQWKAGFNTGLPNEFKDLYEDGWGFYASGVLFVTDRSTGEVYISNPGGAKITLTAAGDLVVDMATSVKLGGEALTAALDGVVTKSCICAFTGAPHPDASTSVMAKK